MHYTCDLLTSFEISSIDDLLLKNYKQTVHDLQNHKILLERAESIGQIEVYGPQMEQD